MQEELRKRLDRLARTQGVMTGAQWRAKAAEEAGRRASGAYEIWNTVPGQITGTAEAGFYLVRRDFPLDTPHGASTLGDALNAEARHISLSANDDELAQFDPRTAVFVDTETTGLMGGTGTVTFLVGIGYFIDDAFRLDQCFMRDYDDEEPMLAFLKERFAQAQTLVSFNGKSFDLPLLRTRFITNRVPCRLDSLMHFDLVHAARRFWRARLGDCSLGNVEREIMGIRRQGDVDSALIPRLWLDYLHTRDARGLVPVFYHHKMDILSLVALTGMLSRMIAVPGGEGFPHQEDRLSLVRLHFRRKQYDEVLALGPPLLELLDQEDLRRECYECLALAAKRRGQFDAMEEFWSGLIAEFPWYVPAYGELAKHLEHHKRDLDGAAQLCRTALSALEKRSAFDAPAAALALAMSQRLARIERKLGGGGPAE